MRGGDRPRCQLTRLLRRWSGLRTAPSSSSASRLLPSGITNIPKSSVCAQKTQLHTVAMTTHKNPRRLIRKGSESGALRGTVAGFLSLRLKLWDGGATPGYLLRDGGHVHPEALRSLLQLFDVHLQEQRDDALTWVHLVLRRLKRSFSEHLQQLYCSQRHLFTKQSIFSYTSWKFKRSTHRKH